MQRRMEPQELQLQVMQLAILAFLVFLTSNHAGFLRLRCRMQAQVLRLALLIEFCTLQEVSAKAALLLIRERHMHT